MFSISILHFWLVFFCQRNSKKTDIEFPYPKWSFRGHFHLIWKVSSIQINGRLSMGTFWIFIFFANEHSNVIASLNLWSWSYVRFWEKSEVKVLKKQRNNFDIWHFSLCAIDEKEIRIQITLLYFSVCFFAWSLS